MAGLTTLPRRAALAAPLAALLPARLGAGAVPPVTVGQAFLADSLDPTQGSAGWALQSHGLAEALFTTDRSGAAVPNLARDARRGPEDAWEVTLLPGLRFSDGVSCDAHAVAASLRRALAENPRARTGLGAAARVEATDATTLRIVPERPVGALAPLLAEFPLVIHRRTPGGGFAFTGPWTVREFRRGDRIVLDPNPAFRGGGGRPAAVIRRLADPNALAIGLEAGELDLAFGLAAETLPRLRGRPGITVVSTPVAYQYMLLLNLRRPALADARVRQALSLALDRTQMARAIGGGVPASGLFPAYMPWGLPDPLPASRSRAAALLDEAGWRMEGGLRRREGRLLELTLTAYPQRPDFLTLAPVVRAQLEALGLRLRTEVVEAITPALQEGRFDIAFWTTHVAPGGDPAFALEQYARSGAPLNVMGFADPALDVVLDRLAAAEIPATRHAVAREAATMLNASLPVLPLLTPEWHVGHSARLAGYRPWPSDYHILHAGIR
jgi:peptide/nickel transport system substrate-binding protein